MVVLPSTTCPSDPWAAPEGPWHPATTVVVAWPELCACPPGPCHPVCGPYLYSGEQGPIGPRAWLPYSVVGVSGRKDELGEADRGDQKASEYCCSKVPIQKSETAKRMQREGKRGVLNLCGASSSLICLQCFCLWLCCFQLLSRSFLILDAPLQRGCGQYRMAWGRRTETLLAEKIPWSVLM